MSMDREISHGIWSGSLSINILRVDNDPLYLMDEFEGAFVAIFQGLRSLAPATIEDRVGRGNACGVGRIL
jgi:hypothetical protein